MFSFPFPNAILMCPTSKEKMRMRNQFHLLFIYMFGLLKEWEHE